MKNQPTFRPYIITATGVMSPWLRLRDMVLTILLWCFFFYLLRDFYIFLIDIYHWLHDGTGTARAYPKLRIFQTLTMYTKDLGIMAVIFVAWPLYNRARFANKKRRKQTNSVTPKQMADFFDVDLKQLKEWQENRSMVVTQDRDGRVVRVDAV